MRDGSVTSVHGDAGGRRPVARADRGDPRRGCGAERRRLTALLEGAPGPYRDTVLLNAAAALVVAGRAGDLREGAGIAADSIASGAALAALQALRRETGLGETAAR